MALPVDLPKVEVAFGPYTDAVGDVVPGYLLPFKISPPCELVWNGAVVVPKTLERTPADDGTLTLILPATDIVGLNIEPGWTYTVERPEALGGGVVHMALPADTPQVDFDTMVPIPLPGPISPVLVPAEWATQAQAAAAVAAQSASDAAAASAATAADREQTGEDRAQTSQDAAAAAADREAVSADRQTVEQLVGETRARVSFVINQGDPVPDHAQPGDLVFVVDPVTQIVSAALVTEEPS